MEAEKSPVSFRFGAFMEKNSEKKENGVLCSGLLTSYLRLCKLLIVRGFIRIPFIMSYMKVV